MKTILIILQIFCGWQVKMLHFLTPYFERLSWKKVGALMTVVLFALFYFSPTLSYSSFHYNLIIKQIDSPTSQISNKTIFQKTEHHNENIKKRYDDAKKLNVNQNMTIIKLVKNPKDNLKKLGDKGKESIIQKLKDWKDNFYKQGNNARKLNANCKTIIIQLVEDHNKALKANDASSCWWNDCLRFSLTCFDLLKTWIFFDVDMSCNGQIDGLTDRRTDRPSQTRGCI